MSCQNKDCNAQPNWIRARFLKQPGYYLESEWYCGEACLCKGVVQRLQRRKQPAREKSFQSLLRLKLGHILLESGTITREQLERAIEVQQEQPQERLGTILKSLEFAKERDITMALSRQYGLPVVNLKNQRISPSVLGMVPLEIVQDSRFFPLDHDSANNSLVLVTHDPGDVTNMINLRSILKSEVTIYLADESVVLEMKNEFCKLAAQQKTGEAKPGTHLAEDPTELASFIVNRVKSLNATALNVKYFNELIWARFTVDRKPHDLVVTAA